MSENNPRDLSCLLRYQLYAASKMDELELGPGAHPHKHNHKHEQGGEIEIEVEVEEDAAANNVRDRKASKATAAIVKWACEFNRQTWNNTTLPSVPRGDPVATARALWHKYQPQN